MLNRSSDRFVLEVDGKNVTLNNEHIVYDTRIVGGQNADVSFDFGTLTILLDKNH